MSESKNVAEAIANVMRRELAETETRLEATMTTAIAQSEQRTTETFTAALAATKKDITIEIREATEPHFKAINDDLLLIGKKLDNVLAILHDGDRIDELERRVRKLAELAGVPEFTHPIRRPIGA